jgi:hypothetical protein
MCNSGEQTGDNNFESCFTKKKPLRGAVFSESEAKLIRFTINRNIDVNENISMQSNTHG